MQPVISLGEITIEGTADLAALLANDETLIETLRDKKTVRSFSSNRLLIDLVTWQRTTNSNSYIITLGQEHIGLISLSHQHGMSARIGYWIASSHWHKGYTTQAFNLLLELAKDRGFTIVKGKMDRQDIASVRIWKKAGASFSDIDGKYIAELKLT
ncbi:MAG: GNAT family N-acetyltransferase [Microcoleus sp.]